MTKGLSYAVSYRRERDGKTSYKRRLNLLKSGIPRLVIRPSNDHITVQLIGYKADGDFVIASAHSSELKKFNWKFSTGNSSAAYLTGFLCGCRAISKKSGKGILDLGLYPPVKGSRIYSALKGAIDSGLDIPHGGDIFPNDKRIRGEHIKEYAQTLDNKIYEKIFSDYIKNNIDPKDIEKEFENCKKSIEKDLKSKK